jgi:hypothetical protein
VAMIGSPGWGTVIGVVVLVNLNLEASRGRSVVLTPLFKGSATLQLIAMDTKLIDVLVNEIELRFETWSGQYRGSRYLAHRRLRMGITRMNRNCSGGNLNTHFFSSPGAVWAIFPATAAAVSSEVSWTPCGGVIADGAIW